MKQNKAKISLVLIKNTEKEDKEMGKNGNGRGFIGGPRQTLCTELRGNDTVIPNEAWAIHGEEAEELDTGIPRIRDDDGGKMFGRHRKFTSWVGFAADQIEQQAKTPEDELIAKEEEVSLVQAAINWMRLIEVDPTPEMCLVIGAYIEEDMKSPLSRGMDGVVRHYSQSANSAKEAVLEFISRLRTFVEDELREKNFTPQFSEEAGRAIFDRTHAEENKGVGDLIKRIKAMEISSNAKAQMIKRAQSERSGHGTGPAYKLGEALFGYRWKILLCATV